MIVAVASGRFWCVGGGAPQLFRDIVQQNAPADERLLRRMRVLQFLTPEHLAVPDGACGEVLVSLAADQLRELDDPVKVSPAEKLECVANCLQLLADTLTLCSARHDNLPGAEKLLPASGGVVLWLLGAPGSSGRDRRSFRRRGRQFAAGLHLRCAPSAGAASGAGAICTCS